MFGIHSMILGTRHLLPHFFLESAGRFSHNARVNCPSCSEALTSSQERCPRCGALYGVPDMGALAPDPARREAPEPRGKVEPLREIPGLRRREPSWKDEVRERVRHRKRKRSPDEDLPLFPETAADVVEPSEPPQAEGLRDEPSGEITEARFVAAPAALERASALDDVEVASTPVIDLPLHAPERPTLHAVLAEGDKEAAGEEPPALQWDARSWPRAEPQPDAAPAAPSLRPVERPGSFGERAAAAGLDVAALGLAWAAVLYLAGRAARVDLAGLVPAWPYLAAFLAFLGLAYATCFTGLTGQTPGKMLLRLRVVNTAGDPPGHLRAALRAALGVPAVALLVGVFPMFLDPARRGLHDRLLRTRVIRF
jgi:uncharacterized RDD family membrane protein YckC